MQLFSCTVSVARGTVAAMETEGRTPISKQNGLLALLARDGKPPFVLLRWNELARKRGQVHAGMMPGCMPLRDVLGGAYFVCEEEEVAPLLAAAGEGWLRRLRVDEMRALRLMLFMPDGWEGGEKKAVQTGVAVPDTPQVLAMRAAYWRARLRCASLTRHFKVEPIARAKLAAKERNDKQIQKAAAMLVFLRRARGEWHTGKRGRPRHWRTPDEKVVYCRKSQSRKWAKWKWSLKGKRYFHSQKYRERERQRRKRRTIRERNARQLLRLRGEAQQSNVTGNG